jgi:hypothetical protein
MEFISFLISSHERHHERAPHRILLPRRVFLHQALGGVHLRDLGVVSLLGSLDVAKQFPDARRALGAGRPVNRPYTTVDGFLDRAIYFFSAFASAVVSDQVLSGLYSLMAAAVVAVFFPRSF